jgi:phenylacetate-coenzyme A ligase PaaK-like adenylate-forming protein
MTYLDPERFQRIVRHARRTNPFYRRWIPEGGPVPVLPRKIFQECNDEILDGRVPNSCTSGSSGTPVRLFMSPERHALNRRAAELHVKHLGGGLPQVAFIYPHGKTGPAIVSVHTPIPGQVEILRRAHRERQVAAMITYPSNAVLLSQAWLDSGQDGSFLHRVGLMAETIDPGQIALIRRAFPNARIWSNYSAMEFGLIAFQCPYEPEFHHAATGKLGLEILDENGGPCPAGRLGRVVVTDYFNSETPFIRYELGDLAAFASCPCGKIALPALQNIIGKVLGCLRHRDGHRTPFVDLSIALRDMPGMRQFQVVQEEIERFHVRVCGPPELDEKIGAAFEREFGYRPQIDIEHVEEIPREPSGKFFHAICRV